MPPETVRTVGIVGAVAAVPPARKVWSLPKRNAGSKAQDDSLSRSWKKIDHLFYTLAECPAKVTQDILCFVHLLTVELKILGKDCLYVPVLLANEAS